MACTSSSRVRGVERRGVGPSGRTGVSQRCRRRCRRERRTRRCPRPSRRRVTRGAGGRGGSRATAAAAAAAHVAEDPMGRRDPRVALLRVGGCGPADVLVVFDLDAEEASTGDVLVGDEDVEGGAVAGAALVAATGGPLELDLSDLTDMRPQQPLRGGGEVEVLGERAEEVEAERLTRQQIDPQPRPGQRARIPGRRRRLPRPAVWPGWTGSWPASVVCRRPV